MKHKLLLLFLLAFSLGYAQGEANIWYFGDHAGLNFNSGSPIAISDGQLSTQEGCSTICSATGQLLFYTDGITVWNRNHTIMLNGTGLLGDYSASQSSIVVPKPGTTNIYYLFTVTKEAGPNGLRYNEVDMNLDGGLGGITSTKNVLIHTPTCEKISAIKNAANDGYWVVSHEFGTNNFLAFSITASGLNTTPVISSSGSVVTGTVFTTLGYLKISPDGTKLACINRQLNAQVFDFSTATGLVTNPRTLNTKTGGYGVEFSPSSNILYTTTGTNTIFRLELYQYDLTAPNISSTETLIYVLPSTIYNLLHSLEALQLAPDGKIYLTRNDFHALNVINNPNVLGLGCNLSLNAVNISPGATLKSGLPQSIQSIYNVGIIAQGLCFDAATQFTLNTAQNPTNVLWNFGNGDTSTDVNPNYQYPNPGTYNVSVTFTTTNGPNSVSKQITIAPVPIIANPITNQFVCGSATFNLSQFDNTVLGSQSISTFGVAYFSSLTNATNHMNILPNIQNLAIGNTTFFVKVFNLLNTNCSSISSFSITFVQPIAIQPNPIFICDDSTNDGIGLFNLQNQNATILGTQNTSDYTITYHISQNDANANASPLSLNYQNTSNPQTIYVRLQNINAISCYVTTSFQIGLYVMPIAHQPQNMAACDDASNDIIEQFDLSLQNSTVLGSQNAVDFNITYHISQAEANSGTNDIGPLYTNIANHQIIYIRIENKIATTCFDTTSFQLIVRPKPVLLLNDSYTICEGHPLIIQAPSGFSSYLWSNSVTTSSTIITQAGNYSLIVTKDYGDVICNETENFAVVNSNIATITEIETQDWTDYENTITVHVTGDGDYEYSLDNIYFQDSNQFFNLDNGQYVVYVRDKKGCGTALEDVFLLMYPRFFTPNSDSSNDYWKIKFSVSEPNIKIQIFDRYGIFLKELNSLSIGWDGNHNEKLMISDDYWFVVTRENGKQHKGHFTLKR